MGKVRLRKVDRVKVAPHGNQAQYMQQGARARTIRRREAGLIKGNKG